MKSNPNLVMIEALASLGANFDCASENEMKTNLHKVALIFMTFVFF
jgi:diaminopimelate decarboxylase